MRPLIPTILLSLLSAVPFASGQNPQAADGLIVPFTSVLPACASNCGPLYDVQGKCTPPNIASVDQNCFCTDTRLTPFDSGDAGVTQVCGSAATSCGGNSTAQDIIIKWYKSYCSSASATATSSGSASSSTSTSKPKPSGSTGNTTWLSTHWKWVVMLVVLAFVIIGGWIVAVMLRKRYLRKKEKEIEMRPPVAWGPHQLQGSTGGYNYGDGVVDASRGGQSNNPEFNKEAAVVATPATGGRKQKRESRLWKKERT